jgi:hypothetical protein
MTGTGTSVAGAELGAGPGFVAVPRQHGRILRTVATTWLAAQRPSPHSRLTDS